MKRFYRIPLVLVALMSGAGSWAADDIVVSRPNHGGLGDSLYVGAGLGSASFDELNDAALSYSLFGGFDINEVLAIEAAWTDLGEASKNGEKTSSDNVSLGVLGKLPLSTEISLFGKVGMAHWNYDATLNGQSGSDSSTDVYYGLGANYDISGQTSVRFGIDMYSMKPGINGVSTRDDVTLFMIGFTYRP